MIKSSELYSNLLIMSNEAKNFSSMGREFKTNGKTIVKLLPEKEELIKFLHTDIKDFFDEKEKVTVVFDDTLIEKHFAKEMEGTGFFYNSVTGRECNAYKIIACVLTNGKETLPVEVEFLSDPRLIDSSTCDNPKTQLKQNQALNKEKKYNFIKQTIAFLLQYFSKDRLYVAVDGWYMSKEFVAWAANNGIKLDGRARSNSVVTLYDKTGPIRDFKRIKPKGRQRCRKVPIIWHGISLFLIAELRENRHGEFTIVYLFSTYKARKPIDHVKQYKKRWTIEPCYRTCKQNLGLKDCQSTNFSHQQKHILAVFCAYAIAQRYAIKMKLPNVNQAIRSIRAFKYEFLRFSILPSDRIFRDFSH